MTPTEITAVLLTARAPGAIAVVLLAGADVPGLLARISPRRAWPAVGACARVMLATPAGEPLDDALVIHTAPDRYELHLHGGVAVVEGVLETLRAAGARIVDAEQAADLWGAGIEGELQLALNYATTETALRLLLAQPRAWAQWTARWRQFLARPNSSADLWQLHSAVQWLLERSAALARLLTPVRVAIIGPPNAGKSTLANALLGRPVSITHPVAGTTRDWVDAQAIFAAPPMRGGGAVHAPVILVDTAGVRASPDPLERESIARTHRQAERADVIILLLDATRAPSPDDRALLGAYRHRPLVIAANKIDTLPNQALPLPPAYMQMAALPLSAKTRFGLDSLMAGVLAQLDLHVVGEECFAFNPRRRALVHSLSLCNEARACHALLEQIG